MTNKYRPKGSAKNVLLFVECFLLRKLGVNTFASNKTLLNIAKFNQKRSTVPRIKLKVGLINAKFMP